jgi:flotillin
MKNIPSWGPVTASPHEFLVHLRNGRLVTSGHGASCFKWPSDSVGLVPTVITKLSFRADQVTVEKVGVEVSGLAVYRVADPILAFRLMDADRAGLTDILRDMFVGATRRIVANLTLEECLRHRKERVAEALLGEITPVLAGRGRPDDVTDAGWGVVLDTIEIQDVRVLSEEVFQRLQAPYRETLALKSLQAKQTVLDEAARLEHERARVAEQTRVALMAAEEERVLRTREREEAEQRHKMALALAAQEAQIDRERRAAEAALERDALLLEGERKRLEQESALETLRRRAKVPLDDAQLRELMLTHTMPEMARAFRGTFNEVNLQTTSGDLAAVLEQGAAQIGRALKSA